MNFFIVTFDRKQGISYKQFHEDFVNDPDIMRWWHYVQSAYIVGTDANVTQISQLFTRIAKAHGVPTRHLVLAVDLKRRQGVLPHDAWEWIRKNAQD